MNQNLFKSRMILNNDTFKTLAQDMGLARQTLYKKVNGQSEFVQSEIRFFINRWKLTEHDVWCMFLSA